MPHQCVRCGTFYGDGSAEILKGCNCGGKLFFYIKKERFEKAKNVISNLNLSTTDKEQIEKDVFEIAGVDYDKDEPIILDLESIRVKKPGQYELDLVSLFKGEPVIFKLADGKYVIDIAETFKKVRETKK